MPICRFGKLVLPLCIALGLPGATASAQETPVAAIGAYTVTQAELDQAFAGRGRTFAGDLETARENLRNMVIAEHWVDQNYADLVGDAPVVAQALGEARRQVLFNLYAQSSFTPPQPDAADIAAFVDANPEMFGERVIYRFQRLQAAPRSAAQQAHLREVLDARLAGPVDETTMPALTAALAEADIPFTEFRAWAGSEELNQPLRTELEEMVRQGQEVSRGAPENGTTTVILLRDVQPAPADPAALQEAIRGRILQEAFTAHRDSLARTIAEPLLGAAPEERVDNRPTRGKLGALAGIGALCGLAMAAFLPWNARVRTHLAKARRDHLDEDLTALRKPAAVTFLSIVLFLLVAAAPVFLLQGLGLPLLTLESLGAFFGALVLAFVLGWLVWRGAAETLEASRRALIRAEWRVAVLTGIVVIGSGAVSLSPDLAARANAVLAGLP